MFEYVGMSEIIAIFALILSAYSTWHSVSSAKRQNQRLLEMDKESALKEKRADLCASFIKLGSNKHRLKIWNKGIAVARNVRLEFPEGNDVVIESDIEEKFPLESLERHQSVDLIAAVYMQTKSKHVVRLIWEDDAQPYNEKITYPTL